ncbi:unnamed protein product [Phytomonas sp. EM1]|nr:unnamed protein product [Phytomonas sp. EM1]|eukprot:CCW63188.1 unnamed protein product [Phytomonas sp. isolate EM1]
MFRSRQLLTSQLSIHMCVGVVAAPSRGFIQGMAVWSCRLLLSQAGYSALASQTGKTICQESYNLSCQGAIVANYCCSNLHEGCIVHVVSKLINSPIYVSVHGTYFEKTELLVTDSFGFITKLKSL